MNEDLLRRIAEALERIADVMSLGKSSESVESDFVEERDDAKPPSWLNEKNVPTLADELAAFVEDEQPDGDRMWLDRRVVDAFWEGKGLEDRYALSAKNTVLLDKVVGLVEKQRKAREEADLKQEEAAIPDMIAKCRQWAVDRQVKRLVQADVEAILKEDAPRIRHTTVRSVWQQVNLQLKAVS